jgi:hypothetical protein
LTMINYRRPDNAREQGGVVGSLRVYEGRQLSLKSLEIT